MSYIPEVKKYTPKPGGTQPNEHEPTEKTRKLVADMYAAGIPKERIGKHLDIGVVTLDKHYKDQLDLTLDSMNSNLAGNLYYDAINGDKESRKFWLQTRARFAVARPPEEEKQSRTDALLEKLIDKL